MSAINGFAGSVTGQSGSTNALEGKSGWYIYVLPRGAYASAASTGTLITFDGTDESSRYTANHWIQVGTDTGKIRQVTGAAGGSIGVNTAVTVSQNDRILVIGATQPTVTGGSASYQPNTTIYPRDDDAATPVTDSRLTTDSQGNYQFFAADALYDLLGQDSNRSNQGILVDVPVGLATTGALLPDLNNTRDIGSPTRNWNDINFAGSIISGISNLSGSTAFDYYTSTAGLTQGNLFAFGISQSVKVYGDSYGGIHDSWTIPQVVNVKSARFGAKGDNSTIDTTAIANGITFARTSLNGTQGAQVYLPRGTYLIDSQLVLPDNVSLRGDGARATYIKAHATFPTNTALIRLGDGTGQVASSLVQDLAIDCNQIAGSIGIYSTEANEPGVAFNCLIQNYESAGIFLSSLDCQNTQVRDCHLFHTNATATGISYNTVGSKNLIENTTVTSFGIQSSNPAIGTTATQLKILGLHVEFHDTGVYYGVNSTGTIIGAEGHTSVDNLIRTDQEGVLVFDCVASGSTNLVADNANGVTLTSYDSLSNSGGWYMSSNDVAVGVTRSIWTSSTRGTNQVNPNTVFGGTVSFSGRVVQSANLQTGPAFENVAASASITISRNRINLTGGATTISTINPATSDMDGTLIFIVNGEAGDKTFDEGGNIQISAAAANVLTVNDICAFMLRGTTWFQCTQRSDH